MVVQSLIIVILLRVRQSLRQCIWFSEFVRHVSIYSWILPSTLSRGSVFAWVVTLSKIIQALYDHTRPERVTQASILQMLRRRLTFFCHRSGSSDMLRPFVWTLRPQVFKRSCRCVKTATVTESNHVYQSQCLCSSSVHMWSRQAE
jgi:hypothetical protein